MELVVRHWILTDCKYPRLRPPVRSSPPAPNKKGSAFAGPFLLGAMGRIQNARHELLKGIVSMMRPLLLRSESMTLNKAEGLTI